MNVMLHFVLPGRIGEDRELDFPYRAVTPS